MMLPVVSHFTSSYEFPDEQNRRAALIQALLVYILAALFIYTDETGEIPSNHSVGLPSWSAMIQIAFLGLGRPLTDCYSPAARRF